MTRVMTEKTDLAVKKGKEYGEDEVQPEGGTHEERKNPHKEEQEGRRRPEEEKQRPTLHEAGCDDLPLQLHECIR